MPVQEKTVPVQQNMVPVQSCAADEGACAAEEPGTPENGAHRRGGALRCGGAGRDGSVRAGCGRGETRKQRAPAWWSVAVRRDGAGWEGAGLAAA